MTQLHVCCESAGRAKLSLFTVGYDLQVRDGEAEVGVDVEPVGVGMRALDMASDGDDLRLRTGVVDVVYPAH